jgi:DNA polymerase I-like protein with 3'-5' exonuclease and polymerase domains
MQRAHALNEDRKEVVQVPYGLKVLVEEHLGFYHYNDADIRPIVALRNEGQLTQAPLDGLAEYNGVDAYCTWRLYMWQKEWAIAEGYGEQFDRLAFTLQGRLARFLAEMERNGIRANKKQVVALASDDSEIVARQNALLTDFYSTDAVKKANNLLLKARGIPVKGLWGEVGTSGKPGLQVFQIGEKESQRTLFFDVLDLSPAKINRKTNTPSVGKEFFEKHEGVPEIDLFADYMKLQKIRTTYIEGIHKFLQTDPDMRDQRVRPHFKPTGTITGRLSSSNPNMLNIPSRSKDAAAKAIKRLYIVDPGYVMVCADYSQAEVRWLAEATGDQSLIDAFCKAYAAKKACITNPTKENRAYSKLYGDFHYHTASMINEIPIEKVTPEQRGSAKAVVFGIIYGMSEQGLATRLKVTRQKAREFIAAFFARFPVAEKWLNGMEDFGYNEGFVMSPLGRRKLISSRLLLGADNPDTYPEYLKYLKSHRNHELRVCRNAPIQGVASDTNLLACCTLLDHILDNELDWRIINTVYDSIMMEVPYPEAPQCVEVAQGIMEDPKLFAPFGVVPRVPFAADFSMGVSWGDQIDIKYDEEVWEVHCTECGKMRKEKVRPKNRRCEECGSRSVQRSLASGTLDMVMKQVEKDNGLSEYWT